MRSVVGVVLSCALGGIFVAAQTGTADAVVRTRSGAVRGLVEGDVVSYRGIPYAQPPLGALRWRAPQPPTPWTGIRDGSRFSPVCPQLEGNDVVGDEDCLALNVWTPRTRAERLLPVMVYLTGGGNHSQSGQGGGGGNFVGTRLVREGVVLVTLNIRLGALGFLSHPALDAENMRHVSGNYGNQDHLAMLHWVHDNIAAFGGDPAQVFLFGTSAGGASICGLMTSPLAAGLFRAGAMESSVPTGCEYPAMRDAQARTGARLAQATGCDTASDLAACLRAKSPRELVTAVPAVTNLFARTYGPVVDGYVFPEAPIARIASGQAARMPVIMGNTLEETSIWIDTAGLVTDLASYKAAAEGLFGAGLRDRVIAEYPPERYPTPKAAFLRATTDAAFTCTTRRVARTMVQAGGGRVFRYLYAHHRENDPVTAGVGHSSEMPFLFQSWAGYAPGGRDLALSEEMIGFWTRMAKTLDPNPPGATVWKPVNAQGETYMELNVRSTLQTTGEADAHCDFWDSVVVPKPHI